MNDNMKKSILWIFLFCGFVSAILLCVPTVQNLLISVGGKIRGRQLDTAVWAIYMFKFSVMLVFSLCAIAFFSLSPESRFKRIASENSRILVLVALLFIAFMASSQFSSFPILGKLPFTDSSVFIYIGQMMHRGFVPYRDMFDHKGLYLYFIEFLGTTANGYSFIYVIELLNLCFAAIFLYKTSMLTCGIRQASIVTTFFVLCVSGIVVYEGGNLTESYALSFVAFALYEFLKYLKTEDSSPIEIALVGVAFTVVLFLRVNMTAPWVFFVLLFVALLFKTRQFARLGSMVLYFSAGVVLALVPVVLYLLKTGSAKNLWESYILFNFRYVFHGNVNASSRGKLAVAAFFLARFAIPNFLFALTLVKNFRNKFFVANLAAYLFTLYFVVISGRNYPHYGMILLPFFAMPTALAVNTVRRFFLRRSIVPCFGKTEMRIFCIALAVFVISFVFGGAHFVQNNKASRSENSIIQYLADNTRESDDVLVLGNAVAYNIASNRFTKQRFFYQLPILAINHDFFDEFKEQVFSEKPDYIVYLDTTKKSIQETASYAIFNALIEELVERYEKIYFEDGIIFKK